MSRLDNMNNMIINRLVVRRGRGGAVSKHNEPKVKNVESDDDNV